MSEPLTSETRLADRIRDIAKGVYITNAFRAGQLDDIADQVADLEAENKRLSEIEWMYEDLCR